MAAEPIAPGVYDDLPIEEYHADEALSASGARRLIEPSCPAIFRWERDHPVHKDVFDFGTAAHSLVLGDGPELVVVQRTHKDGTVRPADDYQSSSAREHRDELRLADVTPILAKDLEVVSAMAEVIRAHPVASRLLDPQRAAVERSLFWVDPDSGIRCRARPDVMTDVEGRPALADYKTAYQVRPVDLSRAIHTFGYHQQAAWYLDGTLACELADAAPLYLLVFQMKTPPYLVTVAQLDRAAQAIGRRLNRRAIRVFAECTAAGVWPGYSSDVELIGLPPYVENAYLTESAA